MKRLKLFTIVAIGLGLAACSGRLDPNEPLTLKNGGAVALKLAATTTRSMDVPGADQFLITFTDDQSKIVFEKPYPEMPYAVVLKQGSYHAKAEYGENLPFSITTPYYRSDTDFEVEIGQTTDINMNATLHSYIIEINYVSDFAAYFDNYYVQAEVGDTTSYAFAENAPQSAYLAPGSVRLVFRGQLKEGGQYSSVIADISSVGRKRHLCNLNILPKGHLFDLTVDRRVDDIYVSSTVPDGWLPDMPAVTAPMIENFETADLVDPATVALNTIVSFKDICFAFGDRLKTALGITADTLRASNADDLATLSKAGVDFEQGGVIGKKTSSVDLSRMVNEMKTEGGVTTDFDLKIKTVDVVGKTAQGGVTIRVKPPVFEMPQVPLGNIWTKEFMFVPVSQSNVVQGNYEKMVANGGFTYQYNANGSDWVDVPNDQFVLANLTPNGAKYQLRAIYRNVMSTTCDVATAATSAIPLGDLESWSSQKYRSECYKIGDGSIWSTRNSMTTGSGIDSYACRYSGTYPVGGHDGGKGAEIATCGWGSGNTWAGFMFSAKVNNISAGSLFLGSYNNGEVHGYPFSTRPTSLSFYYKYSPHNVDEMRAWVQIENRTDGVTTVLASNEFKSTASSSQYAQQAIMLTYVNTALPATHICVAFYSGKNEGDKDYINGYSNGFYGSRLYVDKISFGYDK